MTRSDEIATQPFSGRDFRNALGSFATGVTVITTQGDDEPYGMTANAFSSLSLDPPLILVCVINGTQGSQAIERNGVFAVNILTAAQEPLSRYFASKDRPRGPDSFADVPHRVVATGSPILDDVAAYLDCRLRGGHREGDHTIYIGEVAALGTDEDSLPLVFHAGRYARIASG